MEYIILIISLVGIVFGADMLVAGAAAIARKYKVSDFVIGAAIVGIGTSMPELVVSFIGALEGNADVAIGNVVGSNIFNVLGILGLTAALFPIVVDKENMKFEIPLCICVSVMLTILVFNVFCGGTPVISRLDGWILLIAFGFFMWYSFYRDKLKKTDETERTNTPNSASNTTHEALWKSILKVVFGLPILIVSCDFFVDNAVLIAKNFGVNDAFISLTLIACGTSLPELAASLVAAAKKNTQLALGNIIGSNIFNITWILGLSAQVMPLNSSGITIVDYCVMIFAAILPLLFGFNGKINRIAGIGMFLCFVAYTWYLLSTQNI